MERPGLVCFGSPPEDTFKTVALRCTNWPMGTQFGVALPATHTYTRPIASEIRFIGNEIHGASQSGYPGSRDGLLFLGAWPAG